MMCSFSVTSILVSLLLYMVSSELRSEDVLEGKAWVALVAMGPKPERRFDQHPEVGSQKASSPEMLPMRMGEIAPRQLWWRKRPPLGHPEQGWVLRSEARTVVKTVTGATSVNWVKVDAGVELEWATPSSENRQQGVLRFRTAPLTVGARVLLVLRPRGEGVDAWRLMPNIERLDLSGCVEKSENFVTINLTTHEVDQNVDEQEDVLQPGQQRRYTLPERPEVYSFSAKLSGKDEPIHRTAYRGPSMKQIHCVLYHQNPQSTKVQISNIVLFP